MPQCPICKSEAEEIDLGLFDGAGFSCKRHGEFRVAGSVFKESRARTRQQWENALVLAERRAALGTRPLMWHRSSLLMLCPPRRRPLL